MNRSGFAQRALVSALTFVALGMARPAWASNLLLNPGFEFPAFTGSTTTVAPSDWQFYAIGTTLDEDRDTFYNNTPGGSVSDYLKVFEAGQQGVQQYFSNGVQGGTPYTFSGYYYFEPNFTGPVGTGGTDAVVDVEMTFLGASNNDVGDFAQFIYASPQAQTDDSAWAAGWATSVGTPVVSPTTATWTQYSVTATAPAGTAKILVSFDYYANTATSGPMLSAFADDGDLEGAGTAPTIPAWSIDSSGDWNNTQNWSTLVIPNAVGAEADFLSAITQNRNVYTDIPVTVGTLKFNNANKYVIDGAGSLTLQVSSGNAAINVQAGTQEINLPLTIASNTVMTVSPGATLVLADPISINSGLTLSQTGGGNVTYESTVTVGSSGSIAFGSTSHASALTLLSSSSASVGGTGTVLTLDNLALASGAKLDVAKDQVDVNYTGASPASTIGSEIATAYANGTWTGAGITSSSASHAAGTSLGYYDTGTQIEIKYTWIGDLNCDGVVNAADLSLMGTAGGGWQHGDLNYDGVVNADDYALYAYGNALAAGRNISVVPEPGVAALLLGGLLLRRRRANSAV